MKDRIAKGLTVIFGYGAILCTFVGIICAALFALGFIIGGNFAVVVSRLLDVILIWLYRAGAVCAVLGIIKMYLADEKEFVLEKPGAGVQKNKKKEG